MSSPPISKRRYTLATTILALSTFQNGHAFGSLTRTETPFRCACTCIHKWQPPPQTTTPPPQALESSTPKSIVVSAGYEEIQNSSYSTTSVESVVRSRRYDFFSGNVDNGGGRQVLMTVLLSMRWCDVRRRGIRGPSPTSKNTTWQSLVFLRFDSSAGTRWTWYCL